MMSAECAFEVARVDLGDVILRRCAASLVAPRRKYDGGSPYHVWGHSYHRSVDTVRRILSADVAHGPAQPLYGQSAAPEFFPGGARTRGSVRDSGADLPGAGRRG